MIGSNAKAIVKEVCDDCLMQDGECSCRQIRESYLDESSSSSGNNESFICAEDTKAAENSKDAKFEMELDEEVKQEFKAQEEETKLEMYENEEERQEMEEMID